MRIKLHNLCILGTRESLSPETLGLVNVLEHRMRARLSWFRPQNSSVYPWKENRAEEPRNIQMFLHYTETHGPGPHRCRPPIHTADVGQRWRVCIWATRSGAGWLRPAWWTNVKGRWCLQCHFFLVQEYQYSGDKGKN